VFEASSIYHPSPFAAMDKVPKALRWLAGQSPPKTLRTRDNSAGADLLGGGFPTSMLAVQDISPAEYPESEFQQQLVPRMFEDPPMGMAQSSTNVEPILPIGDAPRSSTDEPSSFAYRNDNSIVLSSSLSREEEKVDLESELEKLIDNERSSNEELDQSGLQDVALQGPSNSTNHYHPPLPSTNYPSGGKTCMAQDLVFQMGDENPTGVNSSGVSSHVGWRSDHDLHPQADD